MGIEKKKTPITITNVIGVFAVYFGAIFIVLPGIVYVAVFLLYGTVPGELASILDLSVIQWLNWFLILTSVICVIVYTLTLSRDKFNAIWNPGNKNWRGLVSDFFVGAGVWVLSFPTVIIVNQIIDIAIAIISGNRPTEEQVVVNYIREVSYDTWLVTLTSITVIFLVPLAEEIMFRGVVQTWFKESMGRFWSIIITSIFFSALHFSWSQGKANLELLPSLFVLSLFLGYIYEKQRSLWASIGLHSTFNAMSIALILHRG